MNRDSLRDAARNELSTGSSDTTTFSNDELNRAVDEVTGDFSRLIPQELVKEFTLVPDVSSEAFTSHGSHGTFKALANKPIEPGSEAVKNSAETTTYTRDTDYEIDYANGEISTLSGGSISTGASLKVTYVKSKVQLDISGLTNLVTPHRVLLPASAAVPWSEASFFVWGQTLHITSVEKMTQSKWSDKDHLQLFYYATHTAPTDSADGTFPRFLDEVMIKGMVAYALFIKHREQVLQGITDAASARAHLSPVIDPVMVDFDAAITALKATTSGPYDRINTALADLRSASNGGIYQEATAALDAMTASSTGPHVKLAEALDAISFTEINTALGRIAARHTAVESALVDGIAETADSNSALDIVNDRGAEANTALNKVAGILERVWKDASPDTGILQESEDLWASQYSYVNQAKVADSSIDSGAEEYLRSGDNFINAVNLGENAAELSRRYAETSLLIASQFSDRRKDFFLEARELLNTAGTYVAESEQRLARASSHLGESAGRNDLSRVHFEEASIELEQIRLNVQEAAEWANKGRISLEEAGLWNSKGQLYAEEAGGWLAKGRTVIEETNSWVAKANVYLSECQRHLEKARTFEEEANVYLITVERVLSVSTRLLDDARERHADYWSLLMDRVQTARTHNLSSVHQYERSPKGLRVDQRLPTS